MALPQYVTRRGNRLYYRRAFPKDVWPATGKAPFALSLQTESIGEALRARPEAERRYFEAVDKARAEIAAKAGARPLTFAAAESLAAHWFRTRIAEPDAWATLSPQDRELAIEQANEEIAEARRIKAEEGETFIRPARALAQEAGYGADAAAELHLAGLLGRARIALAEVHRRRLVGDYSDRPSDPFYAAIAARPEPPAAVEDLAPQRTVADLIRAYRADKWPSLSAATQRAHEPVFRIVEAALGPDSPVASLSRDDGRRLFGLVQRLPTNLGKRKELAALPVLTAIERAEAQGLPRISPKTINDAYMGHIKALFAWAVREQWIAANPVTRLAVRDPVADADKRLPFGDKLPKLFGAAPWSPPTPDANGRPIDYWGPLIALFMGLRLGEIASLRADAIGSERGHPTLTVRQGKSDNAKRTLVIHPELVRLGFLDMVAARRSAADPMLFAGEKADTKGNWGRKLGERFGRLVKQRGLAGQRLTFHSLRHDFEDALREAGLHGTPLGAFLAGRSQAGKVEAAYGAGYSTTAKADAIAKVRYPQLRIVAGRH